MMNKFSREKLFSANALLAYSSVAVVLLGMASPFIMRHALNDGGFRRFGWKIDLTNWPDTVAYRGNQPLLHTDLKGGGDGSRTVSVWINSGQKLTFRHVPATSDTEFFCEARVNPGWNPGDALPHVDFRVTVIAGGKATAYKTAVVGKREVAGQWKSIAVDLSPFAGQEVNIEIAPIAKLDGIWTLWRDPRIGIRAPGT